MQGISHCILRWFAVALFAAALPWATTPEQFDAFVKGEIAKSGKVIKALNLRVD